LIYSSKLTMNVPLYQFWYHSLIQVLISKYQCSILQYWFFLLFSLYFHIYLCTCSLMTKIIYNFDILLHMFIFDAKGVWFVWVRKRDEKDTKQEKKGKWREAKGWKVRGSKDIDIYDASFYGIFFPQLHVNIAQLILIISQVGCTCI